MKQKYLFAVSKLLAKTGKQARSLNYMGKDYVIDLTGPFSEPFWPAAPYWGLTDGRPNCTKPCRGDSQTSLEKSDQRPSKAGTTADTEAN